MVILALSLARLLAQTSQSQATAATAATVVWQDIAHSRASFVPVDAISDIGDVSGYPVSEAFRLGLRAEIRQRQGVIPGAVPCVRPVIGEMGPRENGTTTLPSEPNSVRETIRRFPLSLVVRVIDLKPGWLLRDRSGHVATLVVFEVLEVLHDPNGTSHAGSVVTRLQDAGSMAKGGATLCTINPGNYRARLGDVALVIGSPDPANPGFVTGSDDYVMPIVDGDVLPTRGSHLFGERAPLSLLRPPARPAD